MQYRLFCDKKCIHFGINLDAEISIWMQSGFYGFDFYATLVARVAGSIPRLTSTNFLCVQTCVYCTESVHRREEGSTEKYKQEVEGVPKGAARGNSRDQMLVFFCTPQLESMYRHYPTFKSDEALAIVIAIYIPILVSKATVKKECIF